MTQWPHDESNWLSKRASFFRAVSAVTPYVNEELDERTRNIVREELANIQTSPTQKPRTKSNIAHLLPLLGSFSEELHKLANMVPGVPGPATVSSTKSLIPRPSLKTTATKYTQVNPPSPGSPAQQHHPVLGPPPVRG